VHVLGTPYSWLQVHLLIILRTWKCHNTLSNEKAYKTALKCDHDRKPLSLERQAKMLLEPAAGGRLSAAFHLKQLRKRNMMNYGFDTGLRQYGQ
jgi:hypothetical protein